MRSSDALQCPVQPVENVEESDDTGSLVNYGCRKKVCDVAVLTSFLPGTCVRMKWFLCALLFLFCFFPEQEICVKFLLFIYC